MSRIRINPDASYMLGLFHCAKSNGSIEIETRNEKVIERFAAIAVNYFKVAPEKIRISKNEATNTASIPSIRVKRMLSKAMEEREHIFKYRNEYSASYFAALSDMCSNENKEGFYLYKIDATDEIILERIGFHTKHEKGRCYIRNAKEFKAFVKQFSAR